MHIRDNLVDAEQGRFGKTTTLCVTTTATAATAAAAAAATAAGGLLCCAARRSSRSEEAHNQRLTLACRWRCCRCSSPARGERGDGCCCEEKVTAADRTIASSCLHPSALRFDSLRAAEPVASLANP